MRKIFNFLKSEEVVIIFLALVLLICSYGPLVYTYLSRVPGMVFLGSVGYPPDFFGNLTSFQEGRLGHWQYFSKISSTVLGPPTFVKSDYVFLGQLNRLLPLDPVIFFHLVRFLLSLILLTVSYLVISKVFAKKSERIIAFFLAFFSTACFGGGRLIDTWTPLAVFQRAAYYPHYLFSFIFILLAIYLLSQPSKLLLASLFGFLASWIHPPTTISMYLCLPIWLALTLLKKEIKNLPKQLISLTIFLLISSIPLFYLYKVSAFYPWNLLSKTDLTYDLSNVISLLEFLTGIGPTAILAIFGGYLAIKKGGQLNLLLAPWSIVYLLGFWLIGRLIGYNSIRFLQTPFFIILGILSVFVLEKIVDLIAKNESRKKQIIFYFLAFVTIALSFPSFIQSLRLSYYNAYNYGGEVYLSGDEIEAVRWLSLNTREDQIILSGPKNGMIIAALTGNIPYWTIFARLLDQTFQLEYNVKNFFRQTWDEKQAKEFLKRSGVSLVFFGREEMIMVAKTGLNYPFLTKIFEKPMVEIYRVNLGPY